MLKFQRYGALGLASLRMSPLSDKKLGKLSWALFLKEPAQLGK